MSCPCSPSWCPSFTCQARQCSCSRLSARAECRGTKPRAGKLCIQALRKANVQHVLQARAKMRTSCQSISSTPTAETRLLPALQAMLSGQLPAGLRGASSQALKAIRTRVTGTRTRIRTGTGHRQDVQAHSEKESHENADPLLGVEAPPDDEAMLRLLLRLSRGCSSALLSERTRAAVCCRASTWSPTQWQTEQLTAAAAGHCCRSCGSLCGHTLLPCALSRQAARRWHQACAPRL